MIYESKLSKDRLSDKSFAVCLIMTPKFPNDKPHNKGLDSPPLAVVGATDIGEEWTFVSLNKKEKDCIGQALIDFPAVVNEWLWCDLFQDT